MSKQKFTEGEIVLVDFNLEQQVIATITGGEQGIGLGIYPYRIHEGQGVNSREYFSNERWMTKIDQPKFKNGQKVATSQNRFAIYVVKSLKYSIPRSAWKYNLRSLNVPDKHVTSELWLFENGLALCEEAVIDAAPLNDYMSSSPRYEYVIHRQQEEIPMKKFDVECTITVMAEDSGGARSLVGGLMYHAEKEERVNKGKIDRIREYKCSSVKIIGGMRIGCDIIEDHETHSAAFNGAVITWER